MLTSRPPVMLLAALLGVLSPLLLSIDATAQEASPSPSRYPSPDCVEYSAVVETRVEGQSVKAGDEVVLRVRVAGNGNRDHEVRLEARGYTRRPELSALAESELEPDGYGLPDEQGRTSATWSARPTTSSRLWGQYSDRCHDGRRRTGETERLLVPVEPLLTLTAVRNGVRDYTFSGRAVSRPGQTVHLYRALADGREVLTARTASTAAGTWRLRRQFQGSGEFAFVARTAADQANTAGTSNARRTVIH